ncbi:MAG: prolipoprotein diacylglyceryl transferase [Chloroflexi bacterium]|nr:prolipoprotein diacylglyceryl transferase [Chloroflexota bacterium]
MEFQREGILLFDQLQIRYYGLIIVFAMLVAAVVAARLAKRAGYDPEHVWGGLTWAIIPGIIFARLWFVLFPSKSVIEAGRDTAWLLQNFFDLQNGAIAIWSGGLSIFGAVLGGLLGVYLYLRRNKQPLGPWLDIAGVALPLAQAIGRWANFVNQELYGTVTTLPWGITIDSAHRVEPFLSTVDYPAATTLFHPLFLYESLWSLLAFVVLLNVFLRYRSRLLPGDIFLLYVMQYAVIRFLLEFLRVDVTLVGGINVSQVVTAVAFVAALLFFVYRHRPGAVRTSQASEQPMA